MKNILLIILLIFICSCKSNVVQKNIDDPQNKSKNEAPQKDILYETERPKNAPDYDKLKTVPYNILAGESYTLKGEKFRGYFIPNGFRNIPAELKAYRKNKILVELRDTKTSGKLYMLISKIYAKDIEKMISKKNKLYIVYSPLALVDGAFPVIEYLDMFDK